MEVLLYDRNLSSPLFIEDLTTKVEGMKFSTRLNGGFHMASWRHKADLPEAWDWLLQRPFYRLEVWDNTELVWEGRLEEPKLTEGAVRMVAYGYYASLTDQYENTAYNTTADAIIKAALTAHSPQINADQSNIDAMDVTITSAADASYLDITIQELVEKVLDFGDSSLDPHFFAIWKDRIPYLKARSAVTLDWQVSLRDFVRFELEHVAGDLANRVSANYLVGGNLTRTAVVNDTDSQEKYGDGTNPLIREYVIPNLGTVTAAAAQAYRDAYLETHKDIQPRLTNMVLGKDTFATAGARDSSARVRAGDVLRVVDLVPASADAGSITLDTLRTFYLKETEYDVDAQTLRIVPDTSLSSLDQLLAKKITR